jgi:hypothetical protein
MSTFSSNQNRVFQINLLQNVDSGFYARFVTALTAMNQLYQLKISLCDNIIGSSRLRRELQRTHAILPTVEVLHLTAVPDSDIILLACPQLKTFVAEDLTRDWKRTLAAIPSLQRLRHLEVKKNHTNWTPRSVKGRPLQFWLGSTLK